MQCNDLNTHTKNISFIPTVLITETQNLVCLLSSDGYLLSMFEVVLTTMETKLRRVENLDRAVQQLMLKLDAMEKRSILQSDAIESKVDAMAKSFDTFRTSNCPLPEVKEDLVAEPSERQPRFWTQNFSAGNSSYK